MEDSKSTAAGPGKESGPPAPQSEKPKRRSRKFEPSPPAGRLEFYEKKLRAQIPFNRAELASVLDELPEVVAERGNVSRLVEWRLIGQIAGQDLVRRMCIEREIQRLRASLTGTDPSAVERLLIDHIVGCHLVGMVTNLRTTTTAANAKEEALRLRQAASAQRRLSSTIGLLTRMRGELPEPKAKGRQPRPRNDEKEAGYVDA